MSASRFCLRLLQSKYFVPNAARLKPSHRNFSVLQCSTVNLQIPCLRTFSSQPSENIAPESKVERVKVKFHTGGDVYDVEGKVGDSLLDVVVDNEVPLDGYGACEGTLACSTCHVVLKQSDYDGLPDKPGDEELDMLDLAYGLCDTSRLGCQIVLTKKLDGLEVDVPAGTYDARLS